MNFGLYISRIAHALLLCQHVHITGKPQAADCVACAVKEAKDNGRSWHHLMCPTCAARGPR